ncbi:hypothetical protein [Neochlamydia sp. S13]|uniref:hypothetical protein n=1 Tax=Neochlamydia sp. S13 TaxID=1353976 RepID=UPI0005A7C13A|nr:hypothetical protein [Neochlamydia sp. S13]BBI17429.1 Uncharacterized protein NCS13_1_1234 [Neochlamydia sp. S13]
MKKNLNRPSLSSDTPLSWSDALLAHPFTQWASDNGKILLYSFLGLIILVFILFQFIWRHHAVSEADFVRAEKEFSLFTSSKDISDPAAEVEALKNLHAIMAAHPELYPKYEGLIAETLLLRGKNEEASLYATSAIKRTAYENDPFYTSYAQATLLLANEKYEEGLKAALNLRNRMLEQAQAFKDTPEKLQYGTFLYALNLLRIAMLQQQLSLFTDELATWKEWEELTLKSHEGTLPFYLKGQLFLSFNNLLSEGKASLADYIEARKKLITK